MMKDIFVRGGGGQSQKGSPHGELSPATKEKSSKKVPITAFFSKREPAAMLAPPPPAGVLLIRNIWLIITKSKEK